MSLAVAALGLGSACGDSNPANDDPTTTLHPTGETNPGATTHAGESESTASSAGPATTQVDDSGSGNDSGPGEGSSGESTGTPPPPSSCGDPPVWCPSPGASWQWQLSGAIDTSVDVSMYDIDLFDVDAGQISSLRSDARIVICYFSAGSHEDWRPDAADFPESAIGNPLDGWPGERWLDIRDDAVRTALAARLDLAVDKGCDGVEPDNVDGYTNNSGFSLNASDQLDFNQWLAEQAHLRGLSIGLKNDLDQVQELLPYFDWALDEECMAYDECDLLMPFIDAGKAVFHVEYVDDPGQGPALADQICPDALDRSFSTLVKGWDLDAWRIACA